MHRSGPGAGSRPLVAFQSQPEPRPWPRDGAGAQGGRRGLTSLPGRVPSGSPRDAVFAREQGPAPPTTSPPHVPPPTRPQRLAGLGAGFSPAAAALRACSVQLVCLRVSQRPGASHASYTFSQAEAGDISAPPEARDRGPQTPPMCVPSDTVSSRDQSSHAALRPQGAAWKAGGWGQQGFLPWVRDARVRGSEPGKGEQAGVKAEPAGSQTSGLRLLVALGKRATFSVQIQPHLWSPPKH